MRRFFVANSFYENMTSEERTKRIGRLLIKGIFIHAKEMGWLDTQENKQKTKKRHRFVKTPDFKEQPSKENTRYYTLTEVAEILNITKRTVQRWIESGKLKTVQKENGHHFVASKEIDFFTS